MALSIFPDDMMKSSSSEMTLENIASKLAYFQLQIHLIHWQTGSYAEHKATNELYDYIESFRDNCMEKLMGYTGKKPKAYKIQPLVDTVNTASIVSELRSFAVQLKEWSKNNMYCDIENMSQELSGESSKILYLLTLS